MGGSSSKEDGDAAAADLPMTKAEKKASIKARKASIKAEKKAEKERRKSESKSKKASPVKKADKKKDDAKGEGEKTTSPAKVIKPDEKKLATKGPKSVQSRLTVKTAVELTDEEKEEKERATKMFKAPEGPKRSKIFQALNPEKLYYESRREKEESKDEADVVKIGFRGGLDFSRMRDDEGNLIEEEESEGEEEEEEDYDPNNLPDFGPFQEEMNKLRAERAKALEEKQEKLRQAHNEKKAAEEARLAAELAKIKAKEDELKKAKEIHADDFVEKTQKRLSEETAGHLDQFKFTADAH